MNAVRPTPNADRKQPRSAFCSALRFHHSAFTLIELLAVLVIFVLLLGTFVPYALSIREAANRTRCEKNLRDIHEAMTNYAAANGYFYPRVRYDPAVGSRWTAFTGPDDANPFASASTVEPNDVSASIWLLVREGLAQPSAFVCPSGAGSADRLDDLAGEITVVKKRGNFRSPSNLNYAYAAPFSTMSDYRLSDTLVARFAIFADCPPSDATTESAGDVRFNSRARLVRKLNSPNHRGDGQNVLYADGSVSFEASPYCGVGRSDRALDGDNIFTALRATPIVAGKPAANEQGVAGQNVGPAYRYDSVLIPPADFVSTPAPAIASSPAPTIESAATLPATAPATAPATTVPSTQP